MSATVAPRMNEGNQVTIYKRPGFFRVGLGFVGLRGLGFRV